MNERIERRGTDRLPSTITRESVTTRSEETVTRGATITVVEVLVTLKSAED